MSDKAREGERISLLQKLNTIFTAAQKRRFLLLAAMIFVGGLLETFGASMLLPVVTAILDPAALHHMLLVAGERVPLLSGITGMLNALEDRALIATLLLTLIAIYVIKNLFVVFLVYRQNRFINHSRNEMVARMMQDFMTRPYEKYLNADIPTTYRLTDVDVPGTYVLVLTLLQLLTEFVVITFLCVFLFVVNWRMTLILLIVLALMTIVNARLLKPSIARNAKETQTLQARIQKFRLEATYGLKDVRILNRQSYYIREYFEDGQKSARYATRYAVLNTLPRVIIETAFMTSVLLFILFFVLGGGSGTSLVAQIAAFGIAAMRLMPGANRINTYLAEIAYREPNLNVVYEKMLEYAGTGGLPVRKDDTPDAAVRLPLEKEIELSHVSYRYPDTEQDIFTDVSLTIPRGRSVGIIGASGAGKSTLVDVLLGLLAPREGQILCDGKDVFAHYDAWLHQIGYIPQSIYLVDEPIRNNIAFGIDDALIDEERIREAVREAQLEDFVGTLPKGLDTATGDRGVRLSGGQRQRIGIARALYHDPEILVFDEATSALDNDTEKALMEAINTFHGKKTMIIIAHRLNTIANCDMIYEVKDGTIVKADLSGRTLYS